MNEIIANIKSLGLDMIDQAKSGHPGIVLGAAPILYTIYGKHMHVCKEDPHWINRDRFVLSAGHGSALLYATLFMSGLDYNREDLQVFRKMHSRTPGHPEIEASPFIEATTGPLGQGLAMGVGMALGQKILEAKNALIDHYIYVLCGDGDLMEGISYEACSFAGSHQLNHLIILYDSNKISLDGSTENVFDENVLERFKAMDFYTEKVEDGENVEEIDAAIHRAKQSGKPSLIEVRTVIGRHSLLENTSAAHGAPLAKDDVIQVKKKINVPLDPFYVNEEAKYQFEMEIKERSSKKYHSFMKSFRKETIPSYEKLLEESSIDIRGLSFPVASKEATRVSNGKIMNEIADSVDIFMGGSADLGSSTKTDLKKYGVIQKTDYSGRNIAFGVREHAMGAILNGLSLYHFKVYGSTFLAFSDYIKPAMRLSAIMKRPVNYIFTHDSVAVGEDGPTHEPIEQLAMMRSMPNLHVFRPCDAKEIAGSWKVMLASTQTPNALILSRSDVSICENSNENLVEKGAYVIYEPNDMPSAILIATGTEVETALTVAKELWLEKKMSIRVVSMPCMELYKNQNTSYQNQILIKDLPTFVLEAGSSLGWEGFVSKQEYLITVDQFGYSGPAADVLEELGLSIPKIKEKIKKELLQEGL